MYSMWSLAEKNEKKNKIAKELQVSFCKIQSQEIDSTREKFWQKAFIHDLYDNTTVIRPKF